MYLAMARVADREGYPEIAEAYKRYAFEEADHASRFAELLGEVVTSSTKKNLELRAEAEYGATGGKTELAKLAKELGYDAGFGPGSYAENVASFAIDEWAKRQAA